MSFREFTLTVTVREEQADEVAAVLDGAAEYIDEFIEVVTCYLREKIV